MHKSIKKWILPRRFCAPWPQNPWIQSIAPSSEPVRAVETASEVVKELQVQRNEPGHSPLIGADGAEWIATDAREGHRGSVEGEFISVPRWMIHH